MYRMAMENGDLVGLRIRNARLEARETLALTAEAVGVSESLLSRIENGHRRPSHDLIERLAGHFSVGIDDLTTSEETPVEPAAARRVETAWPMGAPGGAADDPVTGALVLANLAVSTALEQLRPALKSDDHVERYRACRSLAQLASQPLELLRDVSERDGDPMVREAARQLLHTLWEAYLEADIA